MAKVDTNKQSARRFLRNNGAIIATVLLFVVILSTLLIARYGSLYSIRDIANINPLITTENAELIAVNVNGVIKIIKDDDGSANNSDNKSEDSPNKEVASNQQSSGATANQGNSGNTSTPKPSGGGTTTPSPSLSPSPSISTGPIIPIPPILSPSPSPSPSPSAFKVSIQSQGRTNQRIYDVGFLRFSCDNDHTLQIRVRATSGSGSAKVQWKFDGKVVKTDEDSLKNMTSGDTRTSEVIVTTESFGIYSIEANIVTTNGASLASTDITFSHTCI